MEELLDELIRANEQFEAKDETYQSLDWQFKDQKKVLLLLYTYMYVYLVAVLSTCI